MAILRGELDMGLENKTPSSRSAHVIYQPDADGDATNSPQRSTEETTTPMRPRGLVVMHWLTVLLLCIGVTLILIRDEVDGRAMRMWLLEGHRHFGLFILLL